VTAAIRLLCNFAYEEIWGRTSAARFMDDDSDGTAFAKAESESRAMSLKILRRQLDEGPCLPASDGSWVRLSELAFYNDTDGSSISSTLGLKQELPAAVKHVCPLTELPAGTHVKDYETQLKTLYCSLLGLPTISTVYCERCERLDSVGAPSAAAVTRSQPPQWLVVVTIALQRKTAGLLSEEARALLRERLRSLSIEECPGFRPLLSFPLPPSLRMDGADVPGLKAIEEPMILPQQCTALKNRAEGTTSGCSVFLELGNAKWTLLLRTGTRLQKADASFLAVQVVCGVTSCAGPAKAKGLQNLQGLLQMILSEEDTLRGQWWATPVRLGE
jgi:hypothetical protein